MGRKSSPAPTRRAAPAPAPAPVRAAPAPAPHPPAAAPMARTPPPPAPSQPQVQAPPPMVAQPQPSGGMLSGLGSTIAQGFAFGTGSAIAHRAVGAVADSLTGGSSKPAEKAQAPASTPAAVPSGACELDHQALLQCLNSGNATNCDFYMQALQACQTNNSN